MQGAICREFQMAHAKLSIGIRLVREWVCKRSSVRSERKKVMFSSGNGDKSRFGERKQNTYQGIRTDFSPRERTCRGFSSIALPMSPAPQNSKLLEEETGWTFVTDNTKTSPAQDKATTLSPLIARFLMFWQDHNERPRSSQRAKNSRPLTLPRSVLIGFVLLWVDKLPH